MQVVRIVKFESVRRAGCVAFRRETGNPRVLIGKLVRKFHLKDQEDLKKQ